MKRNRWLRPLALLLSLVLLAGACGGRDDDEESGGDGGGSDGGSDGGGEDGTDGGGGGAPAEAPGFDGTTIRLGVLGATSGQVAVIGEPLNAGLQAWFDDVNANGGIAGQYPVELELRDTAYDPTRAVQEYNAIKDDVVMFAQILGTPVVNAVLEQLNDDEIVAQPGSLDSFWVREQYLLPIGAPYQIQAINALNYYVTEGGGEGQQVCALYSDDPYGEAGLAGFEFAAEQLDIEPAATVSYPPPPAQPDFTAQVGQLQGDGCEMVFIVSTPSQTAAALGKAAETGYAPQWIGQSPTWVGLLADSPLAPYLQENFLLMLEGPAYGDESVPGMAELIRIQEEYSPDQTPDTYYNFGIVEGRAVTQVLEAAVENGDLSREGIVEAMNGLEVIEFDGLLGDYQYGPPEDRVPPTVSSIFSVNPEEPIGLELVEANVEAPFAGDFEFEAE